MITDRSLEERLKLLERRLDDMRTSQLQLGQSAVQKAGGIVLVEEDTGSITDLAHGTPTTLGSVTIQVPEWVETLTVIGLGTISLFNDADYILLDGFIRIDGVLQPDSASIQTTISATTFTFCGVTPVWATALSNPGPTVDVDLRANQDSQGSNTADGQFALTAIAIGV